jgi:hypothetical protein
VVERTTDGFRTSHAGQTRLVSFQCLTSASTKIGASGPAMPDLGSNPAVLASSLKLSPSDRS